jgi:hypothetical protein
MHKIYIYKNSSFPVHDDTPEYRGYVPFSKINLSKNYLIVDNPEEADFFYMGQFTCLGKPFQKKDFEYFDLFANKHICDLEGDWTYNFAAKDILENCIITTNGAKKEYSQFYDRIFIRPTFSKLLINLVKNYKKIHYKPNYNRVFAFKGFQDPLGVRIRIANLINKTNLKKDIEFNNTWMGNSSYKNPAVSEYIKKIYNNTFSLCPRGAGVDTVRFFESCYFGRIPIIIGDNLLFGETEYKKKFFFKITPDSTDQQIIDKLVEISNSDNELIDEMSKNCIEFFEKHVITYFKEPDRCFIHWLKRREQASGI